MTLSMLEKAFELSVVISAVDKISSPLKHMTQGMKVPQKEMDNLKKAMSMMQKSLGQDVNKIMDGLRKLETQRYLKSIEKDLRDVGLKSKDIDNLAKSFDNLYRKQKNAADILAKFDKGKDQLHKAGSSALKTVAAGTGVFHLAEKAADLSMMQLQYGSVYGADKNTPVVQDMINRSKDLSTKTLFSQKDLTQIQLELAHGGVNEDVMKNVLNPATYLAEVAVGMGKSSSAEQTAYNYTRMSEDVGITSDTDRMNKFADNIYRLINVTHATDQSIGETFKYGMPTVKGLGWNEQDMLLATGMAARSGLEGSMAGTHIKDFAQRLNPIKAQLANNQKVLGAMWEAGFIDDVQTSKKKNGKIEIDGFGKADLIADPDHIKSYAQLVDEISAKHDQFIAHYKGSTENWKKLTQDEQNNLKEAYKNMTGKELGGGELEWSALMNRIFGEQGQDFALISSHKEMLDKLQKQTDQQMSLNSQIEKIRGEFKGQAHILGSNIDNVFTEVGTKIEEKLTPVLKDVNDYVSKFLDYMKNHPEVTDFLADVALIGTGLAGLKTGFLLLDGARLIFGGGLSTLVAKWGEVAAAASAAAEAEAGALMPGTKGKPGAAKGFLGKLGTAVGTAAGFLALDDLGKFAGDLGASTFDSIFGAGASKLMSAEEIQHEIDIRKAANGPKHALGGIFSQAHTALVAEDGPEAIIPLSKRSRGIDLWQQAGRALGIGTGGIHVAEGAIVINAQPNQSAQDIAREVIRQLGSVSRGMAMNTGINVNIGAV